MRRENASRLHGLGAPNLSLHSSSSSGQKSRYEIFLGAEAKIACMASGSDLVRPCFRLLYAVANDKRSLVDRLWSVCWIGNPRKARLTDLCSARHVTGADPLVCRAPSRSPAAGVAGGWSGLSRYAEQSTAEQIRSVEPTPPPRYANRPSTNRHHPPVCYGASLPHPTSRR